MVDLTAEEFDGAVLVESMQMGGELAGVPTLGFYSHVDQETRRRAVEAGFDRVVPRSRMARETAALAADMIERRRLGRRTAHCYCLAFAGATADGPACESLLGGEGHEERPRNREHADRRRYDGSRRAARDRARSGSPALADFGDFDSPDPPDPNDSPRVDTPNDAGFDRCEADDEEAGQVEPCGSYFDEQFGAFGFVPDTARRRRRRADSVRRLLAAGRAGEASANTAAATRPARSSPAYGRTPRGSTRPATREPWWRSSTPGSSGRRRSWSRRCTSTPPSSFLRRSPRVPSRSAARCHATLSPARRFDANRDGAVNVLDYACDRRVAVAAGDTESDQILDASDLIARFSDDTDDDGNGYVDDIAGWDFFDDDNDPFDASSCCSAVGHGTGRALEAASTTDEGRAGEPGVGEAGMCPDCQVMPLRVWDTFVADTNMFALGTVYATDNGADVVEGAVGGLLNSSFARGAFSYADRRGVALTLVSSDINSANHNYPTNYNEAIYVAGSLPDSAPSDCAVPSLPGVRRRGAGAGVVLGWLPPVLPGDPRRLRRRHARLDSATDHELLPELEPDPVRGQGRHRPDGRDRIREHRSGIGRRGVARLLRAPGAPHAADRQRDPPAPDHHGRGRAPGEHRGHRAARQGEPRVGSPLRLRAREPRGGDGSDPPGPDTAGGAAGRAGLVRADQRRPRGTRGRADPRAGGRVARPGRSVERSSTRAVRTPRTRRSGRFPVRPARARRPASSGGSRAASSRDSPTTATAASRTTPGARRAALADPWPADPYPDPDPERHAFQIRLTVESAGDPRNFGVYRKTLFAYRDDGNRRGWPRPIGSRSQAGRLITGSGGETPPRLVDLDRDNRLDVLLGTSAGELHALDARGRPLPSFGAGAPVTTDPYPVARRHDLPGGVGAEPLEPVRAPAVGDLTGDGEPEIVATAGEHVYAWDRRGERLDGFPVRIRPRLSTPCVRGTEKPCFDADDRLITHDNHIKRGFFGSPALADLDDDGRLDVVAGALDQHVYAWDGRGRPLDGFPAKLATDGAPGAEIVTSPAVADLDGDGGHEIVIATNEVLPGDPGEFDFPGLPQGLIDEFTQAGLGSNLVYALEGDGEPVGGEWPVEIGTLAGDILPLVVPSNDAAAFDLDEDGDDEVAVAAATGQAQIVDGDGSELQTLSNAPAPSAGVLDQTAQVGLADYPSIGDLGTGDPLVLKGSISLGGLANLLAVNQNLPFNHSVQAWSPDTGAYVPGYPVATDDFQLVSQPAIAKVGGGGSGRHALVGTGLYQLHAYGRDGVEPGGWPKFLGGWVQPTPAVGDTDGDGRLEVSAVTREGWSFLWNTPTEACSDGSATTNAEWWTFGHDEFGSHNYGTDSRPPSRPGPIGVVARSGRDQLLAFEASGDDLLCGAPQRYVARGSDTPIRSGADFRSATPLDSEAASAVRASSKGTGHRREATPGRSWRRPVSVRGGARRRRRRQRELRTLSCNRRLG